MTDIGFKHCISNRYKELSIAVSLCECDVGLCEDGGSGPCHFGLSMAHHVFQSQQ